MMPKSMKEVSFSQSSRLGGLVIFAGSTVLALALLVDALRLEMALGLVGSVTVLVGVILVMFGTRVPAQLERIEHIVRETVEMHLTTGLEPAREYGRLGLTEIRVDCSTFDYAPILLESRRLVVVLNDGRTWASVHRDRLRKRLADSGKETTFILTHPDSPMVEILARKGSKDVDAIRGRIRDTVQLLEEIKDANSRLEILGHYLFNPHSLVLGDDAAVVTPFFLSRGGRTVPAFVYHDVGQTCYFRELLKDVELVRMDTKDISSSPRNAVLAEVPRIFPKAL